MWQLEYKIIAELTTQVNIFLCCGCRNRDVEPVNGILNDFLHLPMILDPLDYFPCLG